MFSIPKLDMNNFICEIILEPKSLRVKRDPKRFVYFCKIKEREQTKICLYEN
jgi:hypothetical protein